MSQYNTELISQMTPPLSTEGNLARQVAAGDLEARRQMIEGNMPLVVSKVSAYIRDFPEYGYLRDDLTSVGFMGLVAAVNLMAEKGCGVTAPVEYIGVAVASRLGQFAEAEPMIRIPYGTQWTATANGKRIKVMLPSGIVPETSLDDGSDSLLEMRDLIASCCCCQEERTYIEMREIGYSLQEIADAIGMSLASTHRMKEGLYQRTLAKAELRHIKKGSK